MRIIRICGGLGNQMFQYALYCQFEKSSDRVKVLRLPIGGRIYGLRKWGIVLNHLNPLLSAWLLIDERFNLNSLLRKIFIQNDTSLIKTGKETYLFFEDYKNYKYYEGYWQNLRYLEGVEDRLRDRFDIRKITFSPLNIAWKRKIDNTQSVAIHVRAGDYLKLKKLYGGICDRQYYEQALDYIEKKLDQPVYYVFSNDMNYAKSILPKREYVFVEGNTEADAVEEMMLMRSCKHQIIANSTFSWWAAWLNDYPDKKVVMPEIWINGAAPVNLAEDGWKVL